MDLIHKEKLFGEIGVDLGFFSKTDLVEALLRQKNDEANGNKKVIGFYLLDMKKLNHTQLDAILAIQWQAVRSQPQIEGIK